MERISQNNMLYKMRDSNNAASFLFYILEPLTAEKWQTRTFGGYGWVTDDTVKGERTTLEYEVSLTITDANRLTVWQYSQARLGVMDGLQQALKGKSNAELQDQIGMDAHILATITALKNKWETPALQIAVKYNYKPVQSYENPENDPYVTELFAAQWDETLKPYTGFGLSYSYNNDGLDMRFQGKQVRGIADTVEGKWITEHAGISTYESDAIEVFVVYTNGKPSGFRAATKEEQAEYTKMRNASTQSLKMEERQAKYGSEADYQSLLKLKNTNYQNQSVADFNMGLLEWANEDQSRNERIAVDTAMKDFKVSLTDEERAFVTLTARFSRMENTMKVGSAYTGRPKEDPDFGFRLYKEAEDSKRNAWATLDYQITYNISDDKKMTVGERDRSLAGVIGDIQKFWDNTDIDTLLSMKSADILKQVKSIVARHSNASIVISALDDHVNFEGMSEPTMRD